MKCPKCGADNWAEVREEIYCRAILQHGEFKGHPCCYHLNKKQAQSYLSEPEHKKHNIRKRYFREYMRRKRGCKKI